MNTIVLLVDDEVPFVETMTKRLNKRNLKILNAFSGTQALDVLSKENNVDVVILDVKMPGMDGMETLREMKKMRPLMEVIMLTGHASVESGMKGIQLGAFDYVMKPAEMDDLLEKVHQAYERKTFHEMKIRQSNILG